MRWRAIFAGGLVLAGLQVVVSSEASANRFGGLLTGVGAIARHFLSPFEPAIPDLRKRKPPTPPPPPPPGKPEGPPDPGWRWRPAPPRGV